MVADLLPWEARGTDFSKLGWHTRRWAIYLLLFRFLRISPSYELARKEAKGALTPEDIASLPADFDEVRKTYELLGNVKGSLFRHWWIRRGLKAFGNPYSRPIVQELVSISHGKAGAFSDCVQPIARYVEEHRDHLGKPATLIVGVPLNMSRRELIGQFNKLLETHLGHGEYEMPKPKLQLMGERLHPRKIHKGLTLLTTRAYCPNWALWRVGASTDFSKAYSKKLDAINGPRFTKNPDERYIRLVLAKMTHRAVEKYKAVAENAARGRFPSDAPVEMANFDWPAIGRSLRRIAKAEVSEKKRLRTLENERTKAREAAERIGNPLPVAPSA